MVNHKKLKGAIIGFGFISSKGHLPAYLKRESCDVVIVAISDVCNERKKEVPDGITFYDDFKELLLREGSQLDFIDVSTHAAEHYKIAKMALEMGINVLCEKPLTTNTEEALDLISTALAYECVLFPCHNYKHAPVVCAIREVIESGTIGKVHAITLNTFRNTHAVGTQEWKPNWRRHKELSGGGIAMDHGSHSLYLTFEWLRGFPKSVSANAHNLESKFYDTEDNFSAVYHFDEGVANVHLTWSAGARKVIYTLQGDKGAITVDDDNMEISVIDSDDDENKSHKARWKTENFLISSDWMDSSHVSWFNSLFDKFKKAIAEKDILNDEIKDAYFCVQTIMKSYESINNQSITVPINNVFPNLL
jgi:predicted dehydrogenase